MVCCYDIPDIMYYIFVIYLVASQPAASQYNSLISSWRHQDIEHHIIDQKSSKRFRLPWRRTWTVFDETRNDLAAAGGTGIFQIANAKLSSLQLKRPISQIARCTCLISRNTPWSSNQISEIAGCACAGNTRNVFPATDFKGNRQLASPACITTRASCRCRDACRDC